MAFIGGLVVLVKIMRRLQVTLNSFDVVVSIVLLETSGERMMRIMRWRGSFAGALVVITA